MKSEKNMENNEVFISYISIFKGYQVVHQIGTPKIYNGDPTGEESVSGIIRP